MTFGKIEGISEGEIYIDRKALHEAGLHRPLQAGICGTANKGAESIVLSGGYIDDEDFGNEIIYTGHGGRDQDTGRQIRDQTLDKQNMALAKSCIDGIPIRVIRGKGHRSEFSPLSGYKYDGLYRVDRYWKEGGRDGYKIWRFSLLKIQGDVEENQPLISKTSRTEQTIQRIVRNTKIGNNIKNLYNFTCQICLQPVKISGNNRYCEAAHIKPLGKPHNGPDVEENILCLCPNDHVRFDNGGLLINDDFTICNTNKKLFLKPSHKINIEYIRYHRNLWI